MANTVCLCILHVGPWNLNNKNISVWETLMKSNRDYVHMYSSYIRNNVNRNLRVQNISRQLSFLLCNLLLLPTRDPNKKIIMILYTVISRLHSARSIGLRCLPVLTNVPYQVQDNATYSVLIHTPLHPMTHAVGLVHFHLAVPCSPIRWHHCSNLQHGDDQNATLYIILNLFFHNVTATIYDHL